MGSGAQAAVQVPTGQLTDGWLVRWRARAVAGEASSAWSDWQQVKVDLVGPGEEPLAVTAGPVIRTDQSFTVAAWLRWSDKDGDYSIVEQRGAGQAPFRLGNTPNHGLVFTLTSADAANAATAGVLSDVEPPVNEWFHLTGAYDAAARTASLYLNGALVKTEPVGFDLWNAETGLSLGASMRGALDDVRIYQKALIAADVAIVYQGGAVSLTAPVLPQATPDDEKPSKKDAARATAADDSYRFGWSECTDDQKVLFFRVSDFNRVGGWLKNRFSWCFWGHAVLTVEKENTKGKRETLADGVVTVTLIGETNQNNREFVVKARVSEFQTGVAGDDDGWFDDMQVGVQMRSTGSVSLNGQTRVITTPETSNTCQRTGVSNREYGTIQQWENEKTAMFNFFSPMNKSLMGEEYRHHCSLQLSMGIKHPTRNFLNEDHFDNNPDPISGVRCDTAAYIGNAAGGCIFYGIIPSLIAKQDGGYPTQVQHFRYARDHTDSTFPWHPGKKIPGFSRTSLISRCASDPVCGKKGTNRKEARKACRAAFGVNYSRKYAVPVGGVPEDTNQPDEPDGILNDGIVDYPGRQGDCDEFPFNATWEGSSQASRQPPTYNFSVWVIDGKHNQNFGGKVAGPWMAKERLLNHDKFFVDIQ
ncbi:LamG-like jellyroll fold domain-containing protein [Streptosporangium subroseum]|uniref:LamG-like jellyroll fold domain-containing protein n=1 Tax=Streptosporangium subroseum TaxID=106412 RepID=UPI003088B37C|nr:hypothetical protein OHB15_28600 [Streptosporangium subroseum]